jgi:RNA polymerase sigma factor (sigma-70 family)
MQWPWVPFCFRSAPSGLGQSVLCGVGFLPGSQGALFLAPPAWDQAIMDQENAFPDMETGYTRYRGLLFDALARLARQGFTVQPADALDLIQDFFADAWGGLAKHYDPACGSTGNYVYGAFVRFARQRILRLQKWKSRLRDLAALAEQVAAQAGPSPLGALVREEEATMVQQAVSELPPERRTVLLDYFASGPRSQRQLAQKYGVTRYRLHELLINGFGQVIVRLAAHGARPLPDREVAVALWCEGRGLEETAAQLGRPVQQVRETRDRLARFIAGALGSSPAGSPPLSQPVLSESSTH